MIRVQGKSQIMQKYSSKVSILIYSNPVQVNLTRPILNMWLQAQQIKAYETTTSNLILLAQTRIGAVLTFASRTTSRCRKAALATTTATLVGKEGAHQVKIRMLVMERPVTSKRLTRGSITWIHCNHVLKSNLASNSQTKIGSNTLTIQTMEDHL